MAQLTVCKKEQESAREGKRQRARDSLGDRKAERQIERHRKRERARALTNLVPRQVAQPFNPDGSIKNEDYDEPAPTVTLHPDH